MNRLFLRSSHLTALSFASKVALLSFAGTGCDRPVASNNPPSSPPANNNAATPVQTMTVATVTAAPTLAPPPPTAAPPRASNCEATLNATFANHTWGEPVSKEATQCCAQLLSTGKSQAPMFYHCCEVIPNAMNGSIRGCTPWGPPVPASIAWKAASSSASSSAAAGAAGAAAAKRVLDLRADARRSDGALAIAMPMDMDEETRALAIETWRGRMINEHTSATVFEQLAEQLTPVLLASESDADGAGAAAAAALLDEVRAFADEERRHGVLCGRVVEALGGEAMTNDAFTPDAFPLHEDAKTPAEAALRNVLSICCLSETVAVALIGAERLEMPEGDLRDLLTEIWSDEIGHARFGWRVAEKLIAKQDEATRARLASYLDEIAFHHLIDHELAHLPTTAKTPTGGEAYGLCNGQEARTLFYATLEEVIHPRLTALGLPLTQRTSQAA